LAARISSQKYTFTKKQKKKRRKTTIKMHLSLLLAPLSAAVVAAAGSCEVYYATGECISTSECASQGLLSTPNYCPDDPEDIQCCTEIPDPEIPETNCQAHVIEAGEVILSEKPGIVHVVWCYADKSGEHGEGLALDLMVGVCVFSPIFRSCPFSLC
jgi:hypothetical protein